MPSWAKDEKKWKKAKAIAAEEGRAEDWAYVTGIYKRMGGEIQGEGEMEKAEAVERLASLLKAVPPAAAKDEPLDEARIKGANRTKPGEYKDVEKFADPRNYKYPLDNPDHIRAALAYFGKPANHGMYTEDERKSIAQRIASAAKGAGIEVGDDWKRKFGLSIEKAFSVESALNMAPAAPGDEFGQGLRTLLGDPL